MRWLVCGSVVGSHLKPERKKLSLLVVSTNNEKKTKRADQFVVLWESLGQRSTLPALDYQQQQQNMKTTASSLLLFFLGGIDAFAPSIHTAKIQQRAPAALSALPDVVAFPDSISNVAAAASSVDATSVMDSSPPVALLAAAAVAIAAIAGITVSGGASASGDKTTTAGEPEPEPIDVSIPYKAAAELAYMKSKGVKSIKDVEDFKAFEAAYEEATVASVTLKKKQRDLALFEAEVTKKMAALENTKA